MVHSGVLYISGRRWAPKRRGARGSLPLYSTLSTGLLVTEIFWYRYSIINNSAQKKNIFQRNLVISLAIYWRLIARNVI